METAKLEGTSTASSREDKVRKIFDQFDLNGDGGLNREEMAALVVAVNPRVKFSEAQIQAILDEVFRTYGEFIVPSSGLSFDGLLRTYDDGAGDVDRDFDALSLDIPDSSSIASSSFVVVENEGRIESSQFSDVSRNRALPNWASSPHHGVLYEGSRKILEDLEVLIKMLKSKLLRDGKLRGGDDLFSDPGWSRELASESEGKRGVHYDKDSKEYDAFKKELDSLRSRADAGRTIEEAFDAHMAIGRSLYDHQLFEESRKSFKRASESQPTDPRPHFRAGNCAYMLLKVAEAKEEFVLALDAAENGGNQFVGLLPQIHVNLGIAFEGEGMLLTACEHYREAAILCPTHYRALKLLGSALFGVGEYRAAEKALEEAVFLRPEYADAHCDLGSVLHALGEDEKGIQEYQKAIDLKSDHPDALYNLGGLFMDVGRYARASEMYGRVLTLNTNNWRAQLNKAVSLLGAGEAEEARKALKEAFRMTKRVELYDAIAHLKVLKKKQKGAAATAEFDDRGGGGFVVTDASKFKRVGKKTTRREELAIALEIRAFQKLTRFNNCSVDSLSKELKENKVPITYSGIGAPGKSIRKATLEVSLRRLLSLLNAEAFQGAVRTINERILAVLDVGGSGRVDLGMFYAILAPICSGTIEMRKRAAFDALQWRSVDESNPQVMKSDADMYIKYLRAVYIPSRGLSETMEIHGEADSSTVSFSEFVQMFDDPDWGFGVLSTLVKLENGDRIRHGRHCCSVCLYPVTGPRFKEMSSHFSLCSECYSEGKVPSSFSQQEDFKFKEYDREAEAVKDKFKFFSIHSKASVVET